MVWLCLHVSCDIEVVKAYCRLLVGIKRCSTLLTDGNYLPSEYKHDSFELRFTPSLNFEATGERIPFGLLRERNEERDERAEQARALRDEGMTLQQIADVLGYRSPQSVSNLLNRA